MTTRAYIFTKKTCRISSKQIPECTVVVVVVKLGFRYSIRFVRIPLLAVMLFQYVNALDCLNDIRTNATLNETTVRFE